MPCLLELHAFGLVSCGRSSGVLQDKRVYTGCTDVLCSVEGDLQGCSLTGLTSRLRTGLLRLRVPLAPVAGLGVMLSHRCPGLMSGHALLRPVACVPCHLITRSLFSWWSAAWIPGAIVVRQLGLVSLGVLKCDFSRVLQRQDGFLLQKSS